ncbi:hypothetical protein ACHWQZ_G004231 [Mnemiopsis leidyi]
MSEIAEAGKIPRPVLKGRHERHLWRGCATTGASIFAYYGIYKHHLWWQRFWGNFDHEARKERIADNEDVFMKKWEYFWRTGKWVGNGYVVPPELPEGTAVANHPWLTRRN